jgi:hypothetical protein
VAMLRELSLLLNPRLRLVFPKKKKKRFLCFGSYPNG